MEIDFRINQMNPEADFARIATEIMNHWILRIESKAYRIAEIEFYMHSPLHIDQYTHAHEQQKQSGKWYFHRSGMDLCFGSDEFYGGILIRAIFDLENKRYVYGPLNSVTEILSHWGDIYQSNLSFGLTTEGADKIAFEKPVRAPRIGLNPDKDPAMYSRFYRFLVLPKQKHAEKSKISEAMKQDGYSDEDIKQIFGNNPY